MALTIQSNVASLDAQRNLSKSQQALSANFTRLSSGFRISSAADDAAGLAISSTLKTQARGYAVAERNANSAVSIAQTAEAGLNEQQTLLTRMRELAVQASNGDLTDTDRSFLNSEHKQLLDQVDRIAKTGRFGDTELLSDAAAGKSLTFQVGVDQDPKNQLVLQLQSSTKAGLGLDGASIETLGGAQATIDAVDAAITAVSKQRAVMGAFMNRADTVIGSVQSERTSIAAASSRLRDVDVSEETAALARNQVLSQAGTSVLAQANQSQQQALALLGR